MASPRGWTRLAAALLFASPLAAAHAQQGIIRGRITEAESGIPVGNARVAVQEGPRIIAQTTTNSTGNYTLTSIEPGTYTVVARLIGYSENGQSVTLPAGGSAEVNLSLAPAPSILNQVIITDSRGTPQKVLDAPAAVSVIDERQIAERPALTVADHVKGQPGMDVSTGGLIQSNIVSRGFNNAFSGAMLILQDNRFASVPSLRVNVPALFPVVNEDIERIELLLGPAAALYGPNSASGVMHLITKSPFTSQGTTLTLDGGERGVFRFSGRNAYVFNSKAGLKVSGEYMQGYDWLYVDRAEPDSLNRPTGTPGQRQRIDNARDYRVRKGGGEARFDLRPADNIEWINTYGLSTVGRGIEITGANGAAQIQNWLYQSFQSRLRWNKTFAQFFMNLSDAGNKDSVDTEGTFLLRTGQPIVDQSRVYSAQLQQGFDLGTRQTFILGGDYIFTNPRTGGTINGRNEEIDDVTEYGGYLHSVSRISNMLEFTTALRLDKHSEMDDLFFSPRAAFVFKPAVNQNFRLTYNRAYSTPANFSFFLDLPAGFIPIGTTGYTIRAFGVPSTGFQFARNCTGGAGNLCMLSPFPIIAPSPTATPTTAPHTVTAAHAGDFYRTIFAGNQTAFINALRAAGVSAANAPVVFGNLLGTTNPTPAQIATVLRLFNPSQVGTPGGPFQRVMAPGEVTDVERLKASFNNVLEVGYKGGLANDRVLLSGAIWREERENFVAPSTNVSPNAFMDPTTLGQLLGARLTAEAMAGRVPAAAVAPLATAFTTALAQVPVGVVVPNSPLNNRAELAFTYRNIDRSITLYGGDVALDVQATDLLGFTANYSYASETEFPDIQSGVDILRINAPQHKGAAAVRLRDDRRGWSGELRGRYTDAFKVNSGVYVGHVPVNALLDVMASYRLPAFPGTATLSLYATNVLNNVVPTFVGVPAIGRMVMGRVAYTF
jgi:outer membrane receptor for ferrienterochelin and colicins